MQHTQISPLYIALQYLVFVLFTYFRVAKCSILADYFNVPIDSDTIPATEINLDVVFVQDEPVVN